MINQKIPLSKLPLKKKARINEINGSNGFKRKLITMGIREQQDIKILSRQPFKGPITIQICGCIVTLGQGMAQQIIVEVI